MNSGSGKITFHNYTDFILNVPVTVEYSYPHSFDIKNEFKIEHKGAPVADVSQYGNSINMSIYDHQLLMIHLFYNKNIGYKINPSIKMTVQPPRVISNGSNSVVTFNKFNNLLCIDPDNYYICIGCFRSITDFILETTVRDTITVNSEQIVLRIQRL